jgi:hypothetical protein
MLLETGCDVDAVSENRSTALLLSASQPPGALRT